MIEVAIWKILACIVLYFFGVSGVDRMVTGVIKPDVPTNQFRAYVIWQSIINQSVALGFSMVLGEMGVLWFVQVLVWVTVTFCWFGGWLDFVYFAMKGEIPNAETVWWWMPFSPSTSQFIVWSLLTLSATAIAWIGVLSSI